MIVSLILKLGKGCQGLHTRLVRELQVGRVEADEMHAFVHTREQNLHPGSLPEHGEKLILLLRRRGTRRGQLRGVHQGSTRQARDDPASQY